MSQDTNAHDPLCPSGTGVSCQCPLIAEVRSDQVRKTLDDFMHAFQIGPRLLGLHIED